MTASAGFLGSVDSSSSLQIKEEEMTKKLLASCNRKIREP